MVAECSIGLERVSWPADDASVPSSVACCSVVNASFNAEVGSTNRQPIGRKWVAETRWAWIRHCRRNVQIVLRSASWEDAATVPHAWRIAIDVWQARSCGAFSL